MRGKEGSRLLSVYGGKTEVFGRNTKKRVVRMRVRMAREMSPQTHQPMLQSGVLWIRLF